MNRTPEDYQAEAMLIQASQFEQKEKDRHYRELLMHMRRQNGAMLQNNPKSIYVFNMISSLIREK